MGLVPLRRRRLLRARQAGAAVFLHFRPPEGIDHSRRHQYLPARDRRCTEGSSACSVCYGGAIRTPLLRGGDRCLRGPARRRLSTHGGGAACALPPIPPVLEMSQGHCVRARGSVHLDWQTQTPGVENPPRFRLSGLPGSSIHGSLGGVQRPRTPMGILSRSRLLRQSCVSPNAHVVLYGMTIVWPSC